MHVVKWVYWDRKAGVPKGYSRSHLMAYKWDNVSLCGIDLSNKDAEYGDGPICKKCEKLAGEVA